MVSLHEKMPHKGQMPQTHFVKNQRLPVLEKETCAIPNTCRQSNSLTEHLLFPIQLEKKRSWMFCSVCVWEWVSEIWQVHYLPRSPSGNSPQLPRSSWQPVCLFAANQQCVIQAGTNSSSSFTGQSHTGVKQLSREQFWGFRRVAVKWNISLCS